MTELLSDTTIGGDSAPSDSGTKISQERGEQTAENIRYGQKLSEEGMGGQTTGQQGQANQGTHFVTPIFMA